MTTRGPAGDLSLRSHLGPAGDAAPEYFASGQEPRPPFRHVPAPRNKLCGSPATNSCDRARCDRRRLWCYLCDTTIRESYASFYDPQAPGRKLEMSRVTHSRPRPRARTAHAFMVEAIELQTALSEGGASSSRRVSRSRGRSRSTGWSRWRRSPELPQKRASRDEGPRDHASGSSSVPRSVFAPRALDDLDRLDRFPVEQSPESAAVTRAYHRHGLLALKLHPLLGRPAEHGLRNCCISRGRTGYVALYQIRRRGRTRWSSWLEASARGRVRER